ncbi:hypothetical protein BHE90_005626 [Fusarium euwallaceae]|uniref:Uncharacterized protein n=3 Tax=Fusarium solani species complex TaxID=232080 RepID=A0A3M2RUF8_9HYPO|nr:hypothetical protein CDV36_011882 [Fusarium kuroshium]RSM03133.1 hypothetical protein CDV31_010617 [Fusarium ambrosium]RTE79893.1 hypothetical protein BHE90_005626 [Fusarium euwallaceae]
MCIENSPSLLCGVDITKYAKGGEYGPNAGLRLCLETKAMFLYACARGYDQDDPAHRQLAIQSCNFDHGDEFLSIISKRLDKTLRHYMKMARTHGLDGDSFNAPADAYQWLVNLKGGIDVEMTDLETVKMNPVLSDSSIRRSYSRLDRKIRHNPWRRPNRSECSSGTSRASSRVSRHSGRSTSTLSSRATTIKSSNSTISSTPTSTKDLSITPPTWAIGDAWDTLFAHAEREAGSGPDSTFRAILVMEQAINEMKIQVDVMCREMMYKF